MFPTGMAGVALLVLRISVAATFVAGGTGHWAQLTSIWMLLGFALPAIFLCFGLLTPYFSTLTGLVQFASLLLHEGQTDFHLIVAILDSGILAVLGPGAYSIDARLFGRRLLTLPPRRQGGRLQK